jgi:hypothetical protein
LRRIVVAGCVAAVLGTAAPAGAEDAGVITERPLAGDASAAEVREFWTPERMRDAVPLASPALEAGAGAAGSAEEPAAGAATAVEQPSTTTYPNSAVGRLFVVVPGVGPAVCTASVVNTDTDSFVFTASHCLFEAGDFFTNVNFVPGYRDGNRPFGEFPAVETAVPFFVRTGRQIPYDHGSVIVARTAAGHPVEEVVGAFGISLFDSPQQSWRAYGYPADVPFDGERLFTCDSRTALLDPSFNPATIGIDCNMTAGASGGPWVIQGKLVASDTSYKLENEPGLLFAPQLREGAAELFAAAHPVKCSRKAPLIVGTEGSDRLVGTKANDVFLGDAGDDVIVGKKGKDLLCGQEGNDRLKGGKGKDVCVGAEGADKANGCEKARKL